MHIMIFADKISYSKVSTSDVMILYREMCEPITTTDKRTMVQLNVLFVLSQICQRIQIIARLSKEMRFAEHMLMKKQTEKSLIDQSVYELKQLEKQVDVESVKSLEKKDILVKECKSRLKKGIIQMVVSFVFPSITLLN